MNPATICRADWLSAQLNDAHKAGDPALVVKLLQDAEREDSTLDFDLERAMDAANSALSKRRARVSRFLRYR